MMGYMYDEHDNNYLPYMICMYVHEKRNELEYKVHYGINQYESEDIQTAQNLSIPTCTLYLHVYNSFDFCQTLPKEEHPSHHPIDTYLQSHGFFRRTSYVHSIRYIYLYLHVISQLT